MRSEITLPDDLTAPGLARAWVRQQVDGLSVDDDLVERVLLALSELVTNAVAHAACAPTVILRDDGNELCIEVIDASPDSAHIRQQSPDEGGGFGLRLVEELADRWGAARKRDGTKVVWFAVAAA